jgi:hypothetical protein
MQRLRSLLWRHRRVTAAALTLIALALLVAAYVGAYHVAAGYATAVEVTIARPDGTVAYNANITDGNEVQRLHRLLNDVRAYPGPNPLIRASMPPCYYGPDYDQHFYSYEVRFSIAGLPTQVFEAGKGCFMDEFTLGFGSPDVRYDPLTASGWSALLGIAPALPDVPAST